MKTIRSFLAIKLDLATVENLATTQRRLKQACREAEMHVRWVPPPNIHLTMRFLGQITEPMAYALKDMLEPIIARTPSFELEAAGIGAFPDLARPRTVWAGVRQGSEELTELNSAIYNRLITAGFNFADHPFKPHITLGRVKSSPPDRFEPCLGEDVNREFGVSTVRYFHCYKSDLSPAGAEYSSLWVMPFNKQAKKLETQETPADQPNNEQTQQDGEAVS